MVSTLIPIFAISLLPSFLPKEILSRFTNKSNSIFWLISLFPTLLIFLIWASRAREVFSLTQTNYSVTILLGNSATFFEKILALISGQAAVEIALLFANFYFLAIFLRKNPDSNFDSYLVEHRARAIFSFVTIAGLTFFFSEKFYQHVSNSSLIVPIGFDSNHLIFTILIYVGILSLLVSCNLWSSASIIGGLNKRAFIFQTISSVTVYLALLFSDINFSIYFEVINSLAYSLILMPLVISLLAFFICIENIQKTTVKQSNQIIIWIFCFSSIFMITSVGYARQFLSDLSIAAILFISLGNLCVIIGCSLPFLFLPYLGFDSQTYAEFTHLRLVICFIPLVILPFSEFQALMVNSFTVAALTSLLLTPIFITSKPENPRLMFEDS
tara:strand:+ start:9620 stop:10774 length:1155 start_codon:yes stop_codon:yes gene_type:complete